MLILPHTHFSQFKGRYNWMIEYTDMKMSSGLGPKNGVSSGSLAAGLPKKTIQRIREISQTVKQ